MLDPLMTVDEVASFLRIEKGTIYNKVSKDEIPFLKVGGALRFSLADIKRWIRRSEF